MCLEMHTFCDLYTCSLETFNLTSIHDTCYRRCSIWCPSMAMHAFALRQRLCQYSICFLYVYLVCHGGGLHNQMSSATMNKCTDLRKYYVSRPMYSGLFSLFWWVLPPLKIFDSFLTPCVYTVCMYVCMYVCSNANPLHYYVIRVPRKADIWRWVWSIFESRTAWADHITCGTSICIVYCRKLKLGWL